MTKDKSLSEKIMYLDEEKGFTKEDVSSALQKVKEDMGDNYFDAIYTSNRYWVMDKRKMSDEKFQDILTLICEDLKKALNKHFGDLDNHSQENSKIPKTLNNPDALRGCKKYYTKGAYTFTCGKSSLKGKIQLCPECSKEKGLCKNCGKTKEKHFGEYCYKNSWEKFEEVSGE